ncbi:metallophosphoesterase [Aquimarina sp. 2201CG14-23]|uniref:metallophosphoesterase n=1 Tax=Aquimarina mycalae TaxID=3040073 RepID=UPI002477E058|nr:metallophosphoesterase [Aquimarina sp. 2201CG14-23]MDH7444863.1 metallophosphoesterase [Aquimarina sp. 2201CG14-23]
MRSNCNLFLYVLVFTLFNCTHYTEYKTKKTNNAEDFFELYDNGYIFIEKGDLIEKKIVNDKVISRQLSSNTYDTIYKPDQEIYKNIDNVVALSDIHGQYDLAIDILKNNKIINNTLDWNYGKGHLVIVGDIFDRGSKVNEMLWLVYKLEKQAKNEGGRVHFILGNHEYMVLHKNLKYVDEEYLLITKLLDMDYDQLYSNRTIIGRWLRSKPTILKINEDIFVHGGISKDFLSSNSFNIKKINEVMRKSIGRSKEEMTAKGFYDNYFGKKGPVWYRGYFRDNLEDQHISKILKQIDSDHIIVGHCSNNEVVQLFDNKIFGVDSSIKKGEYGEVLFIEKGIYSRGTRNGRRVQFNKH